MLRSNCKVFLRGSKGYWAHRQSMMTSFSSFGANGEGESTTLKTYEMHGTGEKNSSEMKTNTGHWLQTDLPKHMGGGDTAPQPVELLLGSLIGCTQATAFFVGRQIMKPSRVLINRMEFDLTAVRDNRGAVEEATDTIDELPSIPSRLQSISGTIHVFTNGSVSKDQLKELERQTEARCPVANMVIASGCKMDVKWKHGVD